MGERIGRHRHRLQHFPFRGPWHIGHRAAQIVACIIDEHVNGQRLPRQDLGNFLRRRRIGKIGGNDRYIPMVAGFELCLQRSETLAAARDKHERIALAREYLGQRRTDSGRGTGHQCAPWN